MDNKEKYKIIVEIKELLNETDVKGPEDTKNVKLISLNASKVLELIYRHPDLEEYFEAKLKEYNELDADKYREALFLRQKQVYYFIPEKFRQYIMFSFADLGIYLNDAPSFVHEAIENLKDDYFAKKEDGIYGSIFSYVDGFKEYSLDTHLKKAVCKETRSILSKFTYLDKDDFRKKIAELCDYAYLSRWEYLSDYLPALDIQKSFYLFIAYQKVLYDMLIFTHGQNLSEDEKLEKKKENAKIIIDEVKTKYRLTDEEFNIIRLRKTLTKKTYKEIGKKCNPSISESNVTQKVISIKNKLTVDSLDGAIYKIELEFGGEIL